MLTAPSEEQFHKSRVRTAFVSVTISIALVLFVMGLVGSLLLQAQALSNEIRENFTVTVFLKTETDPSVVQKTQTLWAQWPEVRSVVFVSKENAAENFQKELGEDFIDFLGFNPLADAIDIRLNADFVSPDQLDALTSRLRKAEVVEDVVFDRDLLSAVHDNVRRISFVLMGTAGILLLIALALINSSIRLSIYSKRFIIRTMQLVGATKPFIHRPFLQQGLRLGALGGALAATLLAITYQGLSLWAPELAPFLGWGTWALLSASMMITGIAIASLSTFGAVRRYLRLNTDDLYFK